jgi:arylsulfatase A-like enzyme
MKSPLPTRPNVILLLTDQERATQHFPPRWEERNLRNLTRLKKHGLSFTRAFCNACMCSPSRSTLFTSLYPAQHQVMDTLTYNGTFSPTETLLDPTLPNLATTLRPAGYRVPYRGKFHLVKGPDGENSLLQEGVSIYGFEGWVPPDAGEDTDVRNFGGGYADHDARYIEQTVDFLRGADPSQPFCLTLSLVNPHDVLSYPQTYTYGYSDADLEGEVRLPSTWNENLRANQKPTAQSQLVVTAPFGIGLLGTRQRKLNYVNFYANLISQIDGQLDPILDLLYGENDEPTELGRNTIVIRAADHGEMGLAHGGMRQKAFNVYEETIRIPLVVSNPVLFPEGKTSDRIVSLIDVLPTIADLCSVAPPAGAKGNSFASMITNPDRQPSGSNDLYFTFDDVRAGFPNNPSAVRAANRIRCIRETRWKYARYFDANGSYPEEFELYDLDNDPTEIANLAYDPAYKKERERLAKKLAQRERDAIS